MSKLFRISCFNFFQGNGLRILSIPGELKNSITYDMICCIDRIIYDPILIPSPLLRATQEFLMATNLLDLLRQRRHELGLSYPMLSKRSGVPIATLKRMLGGDFGKASLQNVCAVAAAMGVTLQGKPDSTPTDYQEKVAKEKAEKLVAMVQGTLALESQAVGAGKIAEMVQKTVHELVAGPPRRLWST
jgi:hypothetical protein